MKIGMLWYDNDPKATLETKIERAAAYYRNKYGKAPNICFVHPSSVAPAETDNLQISGVEIRPSDYMLVNHFWIGLQDDKTIDQVL